MKKMYLFGMILFVSALAAHAQVPEKVAGAVVEGALTEAAVKSGTQVVVQEAIGATVGKTIGAGMSKSVAADIAGVSAGKAVAGSAAGATAAGMGNVGAAKIPVAATKTTGAPLKKVEPYLTKEQVALTKIKTAVSYEPAQAEKVVAAQNAKLQAQLEAQATQSRTFMHNRQLANDFLPQLERVPSFTKVSEADYQKIYGGKDYASYEKALKGVEDLQNELAAAVRANKGILTVDQRDHHFFFELDENVAFAWDKAAQQMMILDPAMQQAYQTMQKMGSYLKRIWTDSNYVYQLDKFYQLRSNNARGVDEFFLGTPVTTQTTLANPLTGATKVKFTKVEGLPVPKKLHVVVLMNSFDLNFIDSKLMVAIKDQPEAADWLVERRDLGELEKQVYNVDFLHDVDVLIGDFTVLQKTVDKQDRALLVKNLRKNGYKGLILTSTQDNPYFFSAGRSVADRVALQDYAKELQELGVDGTLGISWRPEIKEVRYNWKQTADPNVDNLGRRVVDGITKASYFKGGGRGSLKL